jgi:hypothetical protein
MSQSNSASPDPDDTEVPPKAALRAVQVSLDRRDNGGDGAAHGKTSGK